MNERRIARLQEQIKARVAQVISRDMADPRRGLITITRVKLDREMMICKVYWSVLGDEKVRARNERMLNHAALFVQHEVASVLTTRTVPRVQFEFDESILGAIRIDDILRELREEREAREPQGEDGEQAEADPPQ
jgi:ribosome-binding factor A